MIDAQPNMKKHQWDSHVYFSQSTAMPECSATWMDSALDVTGKLSGNESAHDILCAFQRENVPLTLPQRQLISLLVSAENATGEGGYLTNSESPPMGGGRETPFRIALHGPGLGKTSIAEVSRNIFDNRANHVVMHYCNGKLVSIKDDGTKEPVKKKRKTDPNAPKKPQSSYFIYMNENRTKIKEGIVQLHPDATGKDLATMVAKAAGANWAAMASEDKLPYEESYIAAKQEYIEKMKAYKSNAVVQC